MVEITMDTIKTLRERSGVGMMDCKKALQETAGDLEAAVDYLRKKGLATANKKADRVASEGLIGVQVDGTKAVLVEINCETDFVARNEKFQSFATAVTKEALKVSDVDALKELALEGGRNIGETLTDLIGSIGENMAIRRIKHLAVEGGVITSYIHTKAAEGLGKIGVLIALKTDHPEKNEVSELGKQIAMHVAASKPSYCHIEDIDEATLQREKDVLTEQAKDSGKPANVIEKMVEGRIRKFYQENVLAEQIFVIDNETPISKLVEQKAKSLGIQIELTGFACLLLGQSS